MWRNSPISGVSLYVVTKPLIKNFFFSYPLLLQAKSYLMWKIPKRVFLNLCKNQI